METAIIALSIAVVGLAIVVTYLAVKLAASGGGTAEIDALTNKLKISGDALKQAVETNKPTSKEK